MTLDETTDEVYWHNITLILMEYLAKIFHQLKLKTMDVADSSVLIILLLC
jgi:hypothetical protein